jgi:hypothetical protein
MRVLGIPFGLKSNEYYQRYGKKLILNSLVYFMPVFVKCSNGCGGGHGLWSSPEPLVSDSCSNSRHLERTGLGDDLCYIQLAQKSQALG